MKDLQIQERIKSGELLVCNAVVGPRRKVADDLPPLEFDLLVMSWEMFCKWLKGPHFDGMTDYGATRKLIDQFQRAAMALSNPGEHIVFETRKMWQHPDGAVRENLWQCRVTAAVYKGHKVLLFEEAV